MKKTLSKTEARKHVEQFFSKSSFSADELKKIKRLAMKYNIKLGSYKKSFCKSCLSQLKGKIRITKTHKTIECSICRRINKIKI